jgi:toxin ParE1/3/4
MQLVRRPRFLDDLTEAYAYLADRNPSAADQLLDDVEAAASLLAEFPQLGRPREELRPGVRSLRLPRFPHIVIYRLANDSVVLLRLLHGARDIGPGLVPS